MRLAPFRCLLPAFVFVFVSSLSTAHAAVVVDQPLAFVDGRASYIVNGSSGFVTYDRLSLDQGHAITRVSWTGAYFDGSNNANNPVAPSADSWSFRVAADAGGNPGATTDSATVAFGSASATLLGTAGLAGMTVQVYRFSVDLADPLYLAGGVSQWFTVISENDLLEPKFAWLSGSGGDGVSQQMLLGSPGFSGYTDRALTLEGYAVPLPSTALLLGVGGLGLWATGRRRAPG